MRSEEHRHEGGADDGPREARPVKGYGRGDGEDDPGALTQGPEDGELASGEPTVVPEEVDRGDHTLRLATGEAVRVTVSTPVAIPAIASKALKKTIQKARTRRVTVAATDWMPFNSSQTPAARNGVRTSCVTWTKIHRFASSAIPS